MNDNEKFEIRARAVHGLGLWAATKIGLTGDDADCYADSVIDTDFNAPGIEVVFTKLRQDFENKGIAVTDDEMQDIFDTGLKGQDESIPAQ